MSSAKETHTSDAVSHSTPEVGAFRRILPQVLACSAKNSLIWNFGAIMAFPTILIPAVTGLSSDMNPNETLRLTASETTWLASIAFITQPLGSVFSGFVTEPFGRKRSMMFINIPHIVAWIVLYYANSLMTVLISFGLHGIGIGLMEAPIFTYIGEISEPSVRGILLGTSVIAAGIGSFQTFILGNVMSWRMAALISAIIPFTGIIVLSLVPETPIWLLSRNRNASAMKALQWLRGWVSPSAVAEEFQALKRYRSTANSCDACEKELLSCNHEPPSLRSRLRDMLKPRTLKPFTLFLFTCFLFQFCGIMPMKPYIVQILKAYESPISPNFATIWLGVVSMVAVVIMLSTLRRVAIYGFLRLPAGTISFNQGEIKETAVPTKSYIPLIAFLVIQITTSGGIAAIPNMLICELFPFKSRALVTGISASLSYVIGFISIKSYYSLEVAFSLPGVLVFYGVITFFGLFVLYWVLPETEGRTLEDIELYFSDSKRKFTDIHIPMNRLKKRDVDCRRQNVNQA